jgi:hypothetical protein
MKLSREVRDSLTKEQFRFYKQNGYLPPINVSESVVSSVAVNTQLPNIEKVTVLCVKFGTKYGINYVERLRNMVARHMTVPYEFACLTDDPTPITGVRIILQRSSGYLKPWWHKVHMFDPTLDIQGRILYVDLDVVICNNLDKLVSGMNNEFMGIQDFNRKFHANWRMLNSSVMSWRHGTQSDIWHKFVANPAQAQRLHGDQDWTWACAKDRIKFWPKEWIMSYKWEIRSREELVVRTGKSGFKTVRHDVEVHPQCAIAVFHGDPNPDAVHDTFVVDNWQ